MSFERRPKRIAGPGFHVNVRYDDATVSQMRTSSSADSKLKPARSNEVYDIKEMELLVAKKDTAMYYDGYTHCFSAVNGYPATVNLSDIAIKNKILNEVRFVGVAVTEYKPSKAYSEQGFVSQVGGVVTLINESKSVIYPGQKVKLGLEMSLNRHITRDKGIPREKVRFCIEPADDDDKMISKALAKYKIAPCDASNEIAEVEKAANIKGAGKTAAIKRAITALGVKLADNDCASVKPFLKAYRAENELIIGKALGLAKSGDRVEVLLQPRHSY